MNSMIDDLTPLLEQPGSRLVLGGDFNAWLHSQRTESVPYRAVFDRLAELGLGSRIQAKSSVVTNPMPNCVSGQGDQCDNVQTYRHMNRRDSKPWQNDHLFATRSLLPSVTSWEALALDTMWDKSDHCPVVSTFNV